MKIQILSDIHNEFSILPHPHTDADVVILAGDIDIKDRAINWAIQFNKPVLYVFGNHEFYGQNMQEVRDLIKKKTQNTNIIILDNNEAVIDNIRFLGGTLWTDFKLFGTSNEPTSVLEAKLRLNDFRHIELNDKQFMPEESITLHNETVNFLNKKLQEPFSGKTVVITHHAPSMQSIATQYKQDKLSPAFASNLEHLMNEQIALWVHGHVHNSNHYNIHNTRIISNPRGYQFKDDIRSENRDFDPYLVVTI